MNETSRFADIDPLRQMPYGGLQWDDGQWVASWWDERTEQRYGHTDSATGDPNTAIRRAHEHWQRVMADRAAKDGGE